MATDIKFHIPKVGIRITGKTVFIDQYFLAALALAHFGQKFEDEVIKKQVRKLIRDLMKNEPDLHPQMFYRKILSTFLSPSIQKQLEGSASSCLSI